MLRQDGVVSWIRFVSKPVKDFPHAGPPRIPERTEELLIQTPRDDSSIGLGVDFGVAEVRQDKRDAFESFRTLAGPLAPSPRSFAARPDRNPLMVPSAPMS